MRAAVLSVGSELLRGDIVDTNAAFLAGELSQLGFEVWRIQQVGDDLLLESEAVRSLRDPQLREREAVLCVAVARGHV